MKKISIILALLCGLVLPGQARQTTTQTAQVLETGEELVYRVRWGALRVGTLRLFNQGLVDLQGKKLTRLRIEIESNPLIPFLSINDFYESYVDENIIPYYYVAKERKVDHLLRTEYIFLYDQNITLVRTGKEFPYKWELLSEDRVSSEGINRDSLSLLYYARSLSGNRMRDFVVPTFVVKQPDRCFFAEAGELKNIKLQGKEVPAYYLAGKVKFIGIAGIRDDFQGWFSVDEQRVPLRARMKAFFGSITIELEEARNWKGLETFYSHLGSVNK